MTEPRKELALVPFSMEEMRELRRILKGHCRSLANREARGDEVPQRKVEMANAMLHTVTDILLEVETYDIIGDTMRDGTFEEVVKGWGNSIGE